MLILRVPEAITPSDFMNNVAYRSNVHVLCYNETWTVCIRDAFEQFSMYIGPYRTILKKRGWNQADNITYEIGWSCGEFYSRGNCFESRPDCRLYRLRCFVDFRSLFTCSSEGANFNFAIIPKTYQPNIQRYLLTSWHHKPSALFKSVQE
jgi:hypothetical protein